MLASVFGEPALVRGVHPSPQRKQGKADDSTAALVQNGFAGCRSERPATGRR